MKTDVLADALAFVRSRLDVALLELQSGDVDAAIHEIERATTRLAAALSMSRDAAA